MKYKCPECSSELNVDWSFSYDVLPPDYAAKCKNCGWHGFVNKEGQIWGIKKMRSGVPKMNENIPLLNYLHAEPFTEQDYINEILKLRDKIQQLEKENTDLKSKVTYLDRISDEKVALEELFDKYIKYDSKEGGDGEEIYWKELKIYNEDIDKLITSNYNIDIIKD